MENTYSKRDIELDEIHYLAASNMPHDELFKKFAHWDEDELRKIVEFVEWFCWGSTDPIEYTFNIEGKNVYTTFPYEHDEKVMSLIEGMLSKSYTKHRINAANQQAVSGTQNH